MTAPVMSVPKLPAAPAPTPGVSPAPGLKVAAKYGPEIMKLGALEVKPTGIDSVNVHFDTSGRKHVVAAILADSIQGVNLTTSAQMNARCMPAPIDARRAASLIAKSGITGVLGADVRATSAYGSPQMHIQVAAGSDIAKNLFASTIGGVPVVLDVQGD